MDELSDEDIEAFVRMAEGMSAEEMTQVVSWLGGERFAEIVRRVPPEVIHAWNAKRPPDRRYERAAAFCRWMAEMEPDPEVYQPWIQRASFLERGEGEPIPLLLEVEAVMDAHFSGDDLD